MSLDPRTTLVSDQAVASAGSPRITAVQSTLDQVIEEHGGRLNALQDILTVLENRLACIMQDVPPSNAEKQKDMKPTYSSGIVRFIDDSNAELLVRVDQIKAIIARLPT